MVYEEPTRIPRLYNDDDLPWIAKLLDIVEQSVGEPWRVLTERIEHATLGVHASHRAAMLQALRRTLGGAGQRGRIARQVRAMVLGPPALDPAERQARLATAAATLGTTPEDVEALLWVDLAMERPVALPAGRPAETDLAAFANLERIQRCVRRAHDLQLRIWDRANELVRTVARYGLISQIRRDGDATLLDVIGPLALFHSTIVYGRALAQLVPLLADHPRFALDIHCRLGGEDARLHVAPPVWLPPVPGAPRRATSVAERLATDLEALGHMVEREPPPIGSGEHLLFPDLAIDMPLDPVVDLPPDRAPAHWYVEILGFSTLEHLATKLARYRAAGVTRVVLCADRATAPGCDLDDQVCGFTRRVDVDDLLAVIARLAQRTPSAKPQARP
jgi:predicted nuclease of restriction endonuclease-like RecB superfamily